MPQHTAFALPQSWQVLPVAPVLHARPPAVQTPSPVPQQGSPRAPQVPQALLEQVPPPRPFGHAASWAMHWPLLGLQQPPLKHELSEQQLVTPHVAVQRICPGPAGVQVVKGWLQAFPVQQV